MGKDRTIYILNISAQSTIKSFEKAIDIKSISDFIISIQNLSGHRQLFELEQKKMLELPFYISHISHVKKTKLFIELKGTDRKRYLYDLESNKSLYLEENTVVRFSNFNTVYVKKKAANFGPFKILRGELLYHQLFIKKWEIMH